LTLEVGGVTIDGIKVRSYDHRPRPESCISYNYLGTYLGWGAICRAFVCKCTLCYESQCV